MTGGVISAPHGIIGMPDADRESAEIILTAICEPLERTKGKTMDYPTKEELQKSIEWAIEQGGNSNYLLNDYRYPYIWGYYLHVVERWGKAMSLGGIVPATLAQTEEQLSAMLEGRAAEDYPKDHPKYNIDWDIRSSITDNYLRLKKKDGSSVTMMGTFSFDTPEQGAERWLEQIKERVVKGLWMTTEEKQAEDKEIEKEFQDFFDAHCSDKGDCNLKDGCPVRWPGGYGLQGCKTEQENILKDKKL